MITILKNTLRGELVEADVLCVGGGIAGLMAAIRAIEPSVKGVVAEKGNSLHCGNAATGIDHFRCYSQKSMETLKSWSKPYNNRNRWVKTERILACVLECSSEAVTLRIPLPAMLCYKYLLNSVNGQQDYF